MYFFCEKITKKLEILHKIRYNKEVNEILTLGNLIGHCRMTDRGFRTWLQPGLEVPFIFLFVCYLRPILIEIDGAVNK